MGDKLYKKFSIVLIILAVFLRLFYLSQKDFWCDEFLAISLSKIPALSDMIKWIIKNDAHPPLFYALVRIIFHFTQSEFGLRFIPFLFGAGAVFLFYRLLKEAEIKNYFLPLALFTFSPAAILWSQIVKSYSILTFFSLLSLLMLLRYKKSSNVTYGVWWTISSLITLYLHNYGILIITGEVLLLKREIFFKKYSIPLVFIFLFYLPYLAGPILSQIAFVKTAPHSVINPIFRILYTFFYFIFGETLSPLNFVFVIPGIFFFLVFFIKGALTGKNILQKFSLNVLLLGIGIIFLVKATIPQNLIHLQPFFFIVVASGIESIKKEKIKIIFSFLLVLCLFPSLYYYYKQDSLQYHDVSKLIPYRMVSDIIKREEKTGEVIITNENREKRFTDFFEPYSPWDWYYKGKLPILEIHNEEQLEEIYNKYDGFWLILRNTSPEQQWNTEIKNFFIIQKKSVKIREMKLIKNYSFLDVLRGQGKKEYYFLEIYHFAKSI